MHTLNVICSKTDTYIGKGIRLILGGKYNHCSVYFDENDEIIYSFSRVVHCLWFTGAFCKETKKSYLEYEVFSIDISNSQYREMLSIIRQSSEGYCMYNYVNALLLPLGTGFDWRGHYTCSTFVAYLLSKCMLLDKSFLVYTPMDIYNLLKKSQYTHTDLELRYRA